MPALAVVLDGIGEQIDEHLLQAQAVCAHRKIGKTVMIDPDCPRLCQGLDQRQAHVCQIAATHGLDGNLKIAGFDLGQIQ